MKYIHRKGEKPILTWSQTQPCTGNDSDRWHTEVLQLHLSELFSLWQEAATLWHELSLHSGRRQDDITPTGKGELALKQKKKKGKKDYQAPPTIIFWGLLQGPSTTQGKRLPLYDLNFRQIKPGISKLLLTENWSERHFHCFIQESWNWDTKITLAVLRKLFAILNSVFLQSRDFAQG